MTLRIRQLALVGRDLELTVGHLQGVLGASVCFRDPGVKEFGLHNALLQVGDQFLEVVSPIQSGTTAGRLLERRGDSGYMVLLQTDDLDRDRARVDRLGVRVIWQITLSDIRAIHLHPKDIGGAITSLDQPTPASSWRWGGPDWERSAPTEALALLGAEIEARDPKAMALRWAEILGLGAPLHEAPHWQLAVGGGVLRFVQAGPRGEGLGGITLAVKAPNTALARAQARGLPVEGQVVTLCGTRFRLVAAT
jgi:hypothetical protein